MVETMAAGAASVDAGQATRSCLGGPGDRRHGSWCLAWHGRSRHLTCLHRGPVGRRRSGSMTLQSRSGPVVAGGSADRDSALAVLVVLGFGAVFVAVWAPLALTPGRGPPGPGAPGAPAPRLRG